MRSDSPDFDRGFEAGLEHELDVQLRLFFRRAPRPAVPPALELAVERLPQRRFLDRFGLPGRYSFVRVMNAGLVTLSVVLAFVIAAGLLSIRGGYPAASGDQANGPAKMTRVPLTPVSRDPDFLAMGRFDSNTGWVEISALDADDTGHRSSYIRLTEDGGKTWSERRPVPQTAIGMSGTQFVDANHGWASSYALQPMPEPGVATTSTITVTVWRTSDGGLTWRSSSIPFGTLKASGTFQGSVHFRDSLHGEAFDIIGPAFDPATGLAGPSTAAEWTCERFSTSDGGATWSAPRPMPCLPEIRFADSLLGYAFDWSGSPALHVTVDGGQTWTTGTMPPNARPNVGMLLVRRSGATLQALVDWRADGTGMSAILASDDGGRTWTLAGTPFSDVPTIDGYGMGLGLPMALIDEHNLFTATWSYDDNAARLFESNDAGLTWKQVTYTGLTGEIKDFDFLNASNGWASTHTVNTVASLWATTDGGATWKLILSTP